jgi:hypothetical protein
MLDPERRQRRSLANASFHVSASYRGDGPAVKNGIFRYDMKQTLRSAGENNANWKMRGVKDEEALTAVALVKELLVVLWHYCW